ncbi:MAG: fasciclin domain-containing protein [Candidatus Cyclobacteriaceae bacterium M3_2C_046]
MKKPFNHTSLLRLFALLLLVPAIVFISSCDDDNDDDPDPQQNVVELASSNNNLSTLVSAIQAADLESTLSSGGPFTIFAPSNAAFDAVDDDFLNDLLADQDRLAAVLQYHVTSGSFTSDQLSNGPISTLLTGETLNITVSGGNVTINDNAGVTTPNLEASNGIVHIIDAVLLPESEQLEPILDIAAATPDLSTLTSAITSFPDIVTALQGDGPFTVFAPTNAAFESFIAGDDRFGSLEDIPDDVLAQVLQYHVVSGSAVFANDISAGESSVTALQGEDISIDKDGSTVTLNGNATVVIPDVRATNGVVHVIDEVILPPTLQLPTIAGLLTEAGSDTGDDGLSILLDILTGDDYADLLAAASDPSSTLTVFAPTNAAFAALLAALGKENLDQVPDRVVRDIIEYHILGTKALSSDLQAQEYPTLLTDETVEVTLDPVQVDGADVVTPDNFANNGVVHIIDQVILPSLPATLAGSNTVVEVAYFNPDFTTLVDAVLAADPAVLSALLGDGPGGNGITLFAPTNAAFEAAGITSFEGVDLEAVLTYHVVDGRAESGDLSNGQVIPSLYAVDGTPRNLYISLNENGVFVNGTTQVVTPDLDGGNGVIHVINRTLLPAAGTVVDVAVAAATVDDEEARQFTALVAALQRTAEDGSPENLIDALNGDGPFTVFAPTDAAFEAFLGETALADVDINTLISILKYHVVPGRVFSVDLPFLGSNEVETLQGNNVTINVADPVTLTDQNGDNMDAEVISTDILGTNGVIHVIDQVILPE